MESKFYGHTGQVKKDNNSTIVSSSTVHNASQIRTDKLYANEIIHTGPIEVVSGSGALSLDTKVSYIDSTSGVLALTLADGTYEGQTKVIVQNVGANDVVLTPATLLGGTTITTSDVGSSYTLQWLSGSWVAVAVGPTIGAGVVIA
jgi:hypothetical protein